MGRFYGRCGTRAGKKSSQDHDQDLIDVAARETVKHPTRTFAFPFGEVVVENRYGREGNAAVLGGWL